MNVLVFNILENFDLGNFGEGDFDIDFAEGDFDIDFGAKDFDLEDFGFGEFDI